MGDLAQRCPDDREATVFYALALNATALPTDKSYANSLKAAGLLRRSSPSSLAIPAWPTT